MSERRWRHPNQGQQQADGRRWQQGYSNGQQYNDMYDQWQAYHQQQWADPHAYAGHVSQMYQQSAMGWQGGNHASWNSFPAAGGAMQPTSNAWNGYGGGFNGPYEQPFRHRPRAYAPPHARGAGSSNEAIYTNDNISGGKRPYSSISRSRDRRASTQSPSSEHHHTSDQSNESWSRDRRRRAPDPLASEQQSYGSNNRRGETPEPADTGLPSAPRSHYMLQSLQPPRQYPFNSPLPRPLPLLVLDLNGTLVYRSSRSADRSKKPLLRPYLANFLEYCLALHVEQEKYEERMEQWSTWDTARQECSEGDKTKNSNGENANGGFESANATPGDVATDDEKKVHVTVHGSHFWLKQGSVPEPLPNATYRLLIWSSAQPHNVNSMARAFLPPVQAEQLLRVYARDTLVIRQQYRHKSPSVKDLDIIWTALNNVDHTADAESALRAEARLKAQLRFEEYCEAKSRDTDLSDDLQLLAQKNVITPSRKSGEVQSPAAAAYADGFGYGPHNSLLLDDSMDKARLQPFNHILLPEFGAKRARVVAKYIKAHSEETSDDAEISGLDGEIDDDGKAAPDAADAEEPENVLLQVIGVLEHARYQTNVSSWIRFGGLGNFGAMNAEHPNRFQDRKEWHHVNEGLSRAEKLAPRAAKELAKQWTTYFSKPADERTPHERTSLSPQLDVRIAQRTPAFWAGEGERALLRLGIEPRMIS